LYALTGTVHIVFHVNLQIVVSFQSLIVVVVHVMT